MKKHQSLFAASSLLLGGCSGAAPTIAQPAPMAQAAPNANGERKLTLSAKNVINEVALGDAGNLVDEQALAGDPANGSGTPPKTQWEAGWDNQWRYPLQATLDLGANFQVTRVFLYDGEGRNEVTVSTGKPFAWREAFRDPLNAYNSWNEHAVNATTRYLRVSLSGMAKMPELVVYGTPAKTFMTPPAMSRKTVVLRRVRPTFDEFVGANAFIDDPLDKMRTLGWIREYHDWNWDEGDAPAGKYAGFPNNQNAFAPSYAGGGGWDFDDYYRKLKAAGVDVCPAVQGSTTWLTGEDTRARPSEKGMNAEDPAAYRAHADHMFQFAARYGSRQVPDAQLKLAPDQKRLSGLGLLRNFENANEPDKSWAGRVAYSSPFEWAAQCSADYDGHRATMGKTYGVKQADPNARLIMGGLTDNSLDYLRAMKFWADWNRGGDFPVDAINVHHYSAQGSQQQQQGAQGISPEADKMKEKLQVLTAWRDRELPSKEFWVTEFGYDISPGSEQRAPQIGQYSPEDVQAQWLVRSYFALFAAGIDRAAMFMLRDTEDSGNTGGRFGTSGLTRAKGSWAPRPSWFYVSTIKSRLRGMQFSREVPTGNPNILVYEFTRAPNRNNLFSRAFAVWCPTSNDTQVRDFALKLSGTSATMVTLATGHADGVAAPLAVVNGAAKLNVSERPVLVLVK